MTQRKCGCEDGGRHRLDCILTLIKWRDGVLFDLLQIWRPSRAYKRTAGKRDEMARELYEELVTALADEQRTKGR